MAEVKVGQITYTSTTTGRITGYQVEVQHSGLNEHALLKAPDRYILENKLQAKLATWETKWERALARAEAEERQQAINAARLKLKGNREASKVQADEQSQAASAALESMRQILAATLCINDAVDWTALEDHRAFNFLDTNAHPDVAFDKNGLPLSAKLKQVPTRPERPAPPRNQPSESWTASSSRDDWRRNDPTVRLFQRATPRLAISCANGKRRAGLSNG